MSSGVDGTCGFSLHLWSDLAFQEVREFFLGEKFGRKEEKIFRSPEVPAERVPTGGCVIFFRDEALPGH